MKNKRSDWVLDSTQNLEITLSTSAMNAQITKSALFLAILLFATLTANAQSAGVSKSRNGWIEVVKKDAKVSAIVSAVGKPDVIKTDGGFTRYYWFGKVEVGASSPESLIVFVEPFNGEKLIVGLTDGSSLDDVFWFAWASKVRPGL